jgi:phage major head subunit gpT-like protein
MPMTTGSLAKLLYPGVNKFFQTKYNDHATQWTDLFDSFKASRNFVEDVALTGLGLMSQKSELAPISYDTMGQSYTTRYTMAVYALGFQISKELVEDDLYGEVSEKKASALARSARHTQEIIAANVYNRAFTSGYTGGDGSILLVSSHPNKNGGTYSNVLSTAANLSEAAIEQACIDIKKYTDDRGLRINVKPKSLIIPVDLEFEADRLFNSKLRVGTADNDKTSKAFGMFPGGVKVNNFLTSTTAWFIRTDVPEGMKFFERRGMAFDTDNDFDTETAKFKCTHRYAYGWTDPKSLYGTAGV